MQKRRNHVRDFESVAEYIEKIQSRHNPRKTSTLRQDLIEVKLASQRNAFTKQIRRAIEEELRSR